MAKAESKTKLTGASVEDFLNSIEDETKREDCKKISAMMEKTTGAKAKMWGDSIVGFGERVLKYSTGRDVDWMDIGFAPRKANLTLYLTTGETLNADLLAKLGKHKMGMGCLHFKRLSDVDEKVLEKLIEQSVEIARKK